MKQSQKEYVLWATKKGAESWEEELITTAPMTAEGKAKIEKATDWAKGQGFDRIRVSTNDSSVAPDFSKVVSK